MGKRGCLAAAQEAVYGARLTQALNRSVLTSLCSWARRDWGTRGNVDPSPGRGRHAARSFLWDPGSGSEGGKYSFSLPNRPGDCAGHRVSNHGNLPVAQEHAGEKHPLLFMVLNFPCFYHQLPVYVGTRDGLGHLNI